MVATFSDITRFWRVVRDSFRGRRTYASAGQALKAFGLRRDAQFRRSGGLEAIQLRGMPHPVYVRRGTTDFLVVAEVFEKRIYHAVEDCSIRPDATILDLGGNIGLASLFFSRILPHSRIVAVEPDAANAELLRRNCSHLIEAGCLQVVQAFAAATDGMAGIDRSGGNWGFRKTDALADGESIPCLSVPELMRRFALDEIDLLKCDIEGSERELFAGCGGWIHRVSAIAVETHRPYQLADFYAHLDQAGWNFDIIAQRQRSRTGECLVRRKSRTE